MTNLSTSREAQQIRILKTLREQPVTTTQARLELDIMSPASRIKELRNKGYEISTQWQTVETFGNQHRMGKYVLISEPKGE